MAEAAEKYEVAIPPGDVPLTRAQFAKRVGVSPWTLLNYHRDGVFKAFASPPRGGRNHAAIYLESQIDDFRAMPMKVRASDLAHNALYTVEQAQACFKAFDEGKSARWCVVNIGVHPQVVGIIRARYGQLEQGLFITQTSLDAVRELALDGPESIVVCADIVEMVKKLRSRVESLEDALAKARAPLCETCARSKSRFCARCVANTIAEAAKTKGAETEASAPSQRAARSTGGEGVQPTTPRAATTAPGARAPDGRSAAPQAKATERSRPKAASR